MQHPTNTDPITAHLLPAERVLWSGRPDPAKHFSRGDMYLIPFSLIWGGLAIFWEASALMNGSGLFAKLWGLPFLTAGVYFIGGRFAFKAWQKHRTWYAITNQRALVVRGADAPRVEAVFLRNVPTVNQSLDNSGTGSIMFGHVPSAFSSFMNSGIDVFTRRSAQPEIAFFDVPNAREAAVIAYEQVHATKNTQSRVLAGHVTR